MRLNCSTIAPACSTTCAFLTRAGANPDSPRSTGHVHQSRRTPRDPIWQPGRHPLCACATVMTYCRSTSSRGGQLATDSSKMPTNTGPRFCLLSNPAPAPGRARLGVKKSHRLLERRLRQRIRRGSIRRTASKQVLPLSVWGWGTPLSMGYGGFLAHGDPFSGPVIRSAYPTTRQGDHGRYKS
jgi:hypothetical protein